MKETEEGGRAEAMELTRAARGDGESGTKEPLEREDERRRSEEEEECAQRSVLEGVESEGTPPHSEGASRRTDLW